MKFVARFIVHRIKNLLLKQFCCLRALALGGLAVGAASG
jgi:hypothetical protein